MKNVVALLIAAPGGLRRTEAEVLSAGRRLADGLGGTLAAVILGTAEASWDGDAAAYGADRVLRVEHAALAEYQAELMVEAAQSACAALQAEVCLAPSTTYGLEMAPVLAQKLGAAVVTDVIAASGESGQVKITKPVYGGKANSELIARKAPLVLVMRARSVAVLEKKAGAAADTSKLDVQLDATLAKSRIVERKQEASAGVRLEDARIIISGGRGLGGPDGFKLLEELAALLGGTVGASRAACDQGWVPASWQIGQTGKKVAPELYLAVGISGASQHLVGISGAKHIVAVNKDEKAPIFEASEAGVVEDYRTMIPALIEAVKKHRAAEGK
jgi:electron transfer flavoprotein alpha subunit